MEQMNGSPSLLLPVNAVVVVASVVVSFVSPWGAVVGVDAVVGAVISGKAPDASQPKPVYLKIRPGFPELWSLQKSHTNN